MTSSYAYDVGGQLTEITTSHGGATQLRAFTYDNRGFLLSETHPELGLTGNGSVTYSDYDVWGNVGRVQNGAENLRYLYDHLGRQTTIADASQGDRPVKEFLYDTAVGSGLDKVHQAIRHNYGFYPWNPSMEQDITVTETYYYEGVRGGTSRRDTEILPFGYEYTQTFSYDDAGRISGVGYPDCVANGCPQSEPSRTVNYEYDFGFLKKVDGWTNDITYHLNGMWNEIPRTNQVKDIQELWLSNNMPRPKRLKTEGATGGNWGSGVYWYDGVGNIKHRIKGDSDDYLYDEVGRLVEGNVADYNQTYQYDAFGNLLTLTTTDPSGTPATQSNPTDSATNRLTSGTYDAAGRMTAWTTETYVYDPLGQIQHMNNKEWTYLYTADEERISTIYQDGTPQSMIRTIAIRDLSGSVLRRFEAFGPGNNVWQWEGDYVYRDRRLIGSDRNGEGVHHYHSDHLGSPMLITDDLGVNIASHTYLPYGEEITDPDQEGAVFKFTGHERDQHDSGSLDDLDYMHARYYSPHVGRFLRVDPAWGSVGAPQSWNRYSYAVGNPIRFSDRDGRSPYDELEVKVSNDEDGGDCFFPCKSPGGFHAPPTVNKKKPPWSSHISRNPYADTTNARAFVEGFLASPGFVQHGECVLQNTEGDSNEWYGLAYVYPGALSSVFYQYGTSGERGTVWIPRPPEGAIGLYWIHSHTVDDEGRPQFGNLNFSNADKGTARLLEFQGILVNQGFRSFSFYDPRDDVSLIRGIPQGFAGPFPCANAMRVDTSPPR